VSFVPTEPSLFADRRRRLSAALGGAPIFLHGHHALPRNFAANVYRFRQDSSFLYFCGLRRPGCGLRIDAGGISTLFLPVPDPSDALWHGESQSFEAVAAATGVQAVRPATEADTSGCAVLPIADPSQRIEAPSTALVDAVIALRLTRDETEVAAMRRAIAVTAQAHRLAMSVTRPGVRDDAITALIEYVFALGGMDLAYSSIVTARGEVLHGHARGEVLRSGELLLVDAGAEEGGGYAADITRTWPVSGCFSPRQRAVYDAVLAAQEAGISVLKPGVPYRDVHLASARVIARFAVDEGLLLGEVDGLVESGAHAVLFPHGVGHLIGLDVHDMEGYGDRVGYPPGSERSAQFGLSFLRLDRAMEPGMVVTVEPGIYLVPAILNDPELHARFGDSVAWDLARSWLPFGGVRIEDDVLVTELGSEVLSSDIPKDPASIEALVGSRDFPGPTPLPDV
jgi:Xaa-Pro aminopeptidase